MPCFFSKFSCPILKVASTLPSAGMYGGGGLGLHHAYAVNQRKGGGVFARTGRYAGYGAAGAIGGRIAGGVAGAGLGIGVLNATTK